MVKSKTCTVGYSCGQACINRERNCSKELTGQSIELCSQLASLIQDRPSKVAIPKSIQESKALGERGRAELYDKLLAQEFKGPPSSKEMDVISSSLQRVQGKTISSRMDDFIGDTVKGLIGDDEDSLREKTFYEGVKKYQATAEKPSGSIYARFDDITSYKVGSQINSVESFMDFNVKPPKRNGNKGKYLVKVENNSSGFIVPGDSGRVLSDRQYEVVSIVGTTVTLKENGKGRANKSLIDGDASGYAKD